MTTSLDPLRPTPTTPKSRARPCLCWPRMARNGLTKMTLCLLISVGFWLASNERPFVIELVYSTSIGMTSLLFIDSGRFFIDTASPTGFPRGWRGGALIAEGVLVGFLLGTGVGNLFAGF